MATEKKSFNGIIYGVIPGLILPIISIYFFYLFQNNYTDISFTNYISYVIKHGLITKVISVTLVSNLLAFFFFLQTNRYKSARGVILSTVLYAVSAVIYMFVL